MPAKAFVIFFRYKYLLLAPFIVTIPLAIAYVFMSGTTTYQSVGKVRVDRPGFLASEATSGWNPYISLAANQSNFVNSRLKTREFSGRVAESASEGFSRSITEGEVRGTAWSGALSDDLLAVGSTNGDAEAAQRIAQATIDEYAAVEAEQTKADAEVAIQVKEAIVVERITAADAAAKAVADYLAARPELARSPELAERDAQLRALNETARITANAARDAQEDLAQVRRFAEATFIGQAKTFEPIPADAPEVPLAPLGRKTTDLLGPPILAFLVALTMSAILYGFLFRTDRSLRSREDLAAVLPNITFLGSVPDVGAPRKRAWPRDFVRVTATSGDEVEDALRRA